MGILVFSPLSSYYNFVIAIYKKQDKEGTETVSYLDQTKSYASTNHNKEFRSEWEEA